VQLTNDLLEREEQILELKRREADYSQKIQSKDKLYEQDASVRMQLGKKLEQVLMDKEEALEQVGLLKVRHSMIVFLRTIIESSLIAAGTTRYTECFAG
jgi:hypothetical protein